jgi:hypothetical protein
LGFDGTALSSNGDPGVWRVDDAAARRYIITWRGNWLDTLTLSPDGQMLEGSNQGGTRVWGKRKDQSAPWQLPGLYDASHPSWQEPLLLAGDGTFRRTSGMGGTWSFDGRTLALLWSGAGSEELLLRRPGRFVRKDPRFVLVKRPEGSAGPIAGAFDPVKSVAQPTQVIVVQTQPAPVAPTPVVEEQPPAPPPPPQIIVVEKEAPPPPPQIIVVEKQAPPPPTRVIVVEKQAPPPPAPVVVAVDPRLARVIGTWDTSPQRGYFTFAADGTFVRSTGEGGTWTFEKGVVKIKGERSGDDILHFTAPGRLTAQTRNMRLRKRAKPQTL